MGFYLYLCSALFGLIFATSLYPAVTSRSTLSDSSTLSSFDFSSELSSDTSSSLSSKSSSPKDFAIIQTNSYGERDIRVVLGSVRLHVLSVPSDTRYQLELRRTSDRRHYVKSVYKKGLLRDCEFTDNATDIAEFASEFKPQSFEASTKVYPIYRHGRANKKKGKKFKSGGWKIKSTQDGHSNHQKRKNINYNRYDKQNNVSRGKTITLGKHGTARHRRYRRSAGYVLQIPYERNVSESKFMMLIAENSDRNLKPLPYALLFDANDIGSFKPDEKNAYLNLRINPRSETRACRLLYRRVKRQARYSRVRRDPGHKAAPYKIADSQGLPENTKRRKQESRPQKASIPANSPSLGRQISTVNDSQEAPNHKSPLNHPHRHQHHENQHSKPYVSVASRTPVLTPPHRTAASNLTVVAGHVKERQISNPGGRRRSRRQLNGMLIYPGTKWCGNGNTAEAFDDLGSEAAADICCREHDYCPFTIESFTRRFNLFNYRLHTLSHCECDYQFRKCLSKEPEESTVAHLIGRIYFDFLGSRCFVFTKEKYCVERSWWGKCRRYGIQLTAKIKVQEGY